MKEKSGYIFESNGRWFARITATDSLGQRRNIKRTANTKAEARKILGRLQKELKNGNEKNVDVLKMTFNGLCDYYAEHYAKPATFENNQKVEGLRDYKRVQSFVRLFRTHFGRKNLNEITYDDLRTYRSKRLSCDTRRGQRSITSVNRELTYLRRMFNVALRQGWIDRNPFNCGQPLILVSCERKREKILSIEEEQRLLAVCGEPCRRHLRPLVIALLDTGARKGEMLKLTWNDVDIESGVIVIQAMNSKTLRRRELPITARLRAELAELWIASDKNRNSLVFGIRNDVKRSFATACKLAGIMKGGIDGLTIHSLRHTAATRLVQGQLPIELVGRILGHSQPQTTYRYIAASGEALSAARSILERLAVTQNCLGLFIVILLIVTLTGCGRPLGSTQNALPERAPNSQSETPAPNVFTRPEIGMSYAQFAALCKPDASKGDHFNRAETFGEVRMLVELVSTPGREKKDCVGTFRFDNYRLTFKFE